MKSQQTTLKKSSLGENWIKLVINCMSTLNNSCPVLIIVSVHGKGKIVDSVRRDAVLVNWPAFLLSLVLKALC